jgi:hypothetical protein
VWIIYVSHVLGRFSTCVLRVQTSEFYVPLIFHCLGIFISCGNGVSELAIRCRLGQSPKAVVGTLKMKSAIAALAWNLFVHVYILTEIVMTC